MQLIHGTEIEVLRPVEAGTDSMGEPVREWEAETVGNALAQPGSTADLAAERAHGTRAPMTFFLPKGCVGPLKGARIRYLGREYAVIGDPQPHMEANCPTPWGIEVRAEAVDG